MIQNKFQLENTCIKVYCVESKKPIAEFENYRKAEDGVGVPRNSMARKCAKKTRFTSVKMGGIEVTCRVVKKEQAIQQAA